METIDRQYIVDEQNRRIAVQISIETFEKLEEILEIDLHTEAAVTIDADPGILIDIHAAHPKQHFLAERPHGFLLRLHRAAQQEQYRP